MTHPSRYMAAALLLILGGSGAARGDQACDDAVNLPNPVYMTVGDTQINLMKELRAKLRETEQITLV